MLASLIRNLELWLSTVGLLVVWAGASLFGSADNVWHLAALLALGVSVVHGGIFWLVRRRQRTVRLQAIAEIREMMADRVKEPAGHPADVPAARRHQRGDRARH